MQQILALLLGVSFSPLVIQAGTVQVQQLADQVEAFRSRLGISQEVRIVVDPVNERLVSVERARKDQNIFEIHFDEAFLSSLTEVEIGAALAHEFGHIWIFTHHPYLQTEELANNKALLLVGRPDLELVYHRIETFRGEKRDLSHFLTQ